MSGPSPIPSRGLRASADGAQPQYLRLVERVLHRRLVPARSALPTSFRTVRLRYPSLASILVGRPVSSPSVPPIFSRVAGKSGASSQWAVGTAAHNTTFGISETHPCGKHSWCSRSSASRPAGKPWASRRSPAPLLVLPQPRSLTATWPQVPPSVRPATSSRANQSLSSAERGITAGRRTGWPLTTRGRRAAASVTLPMQVLQPAALRPDGSHTPRHLDTTDLRTPARVVSLSIPKDRKDP